MARPLMRGALLLALACVLVWTCRSDRLLFELPEKAAEHQFRMIGHALAQRCGLQFLMTFDEPQPREWIGCGPVQYPGTECVPGRIGKARLFDGNRHTSLSTIAFWPDLGPTYTLSLWVRLEDTGRDQEIWFTTFQSRQVGFRLQDGQLSFFVPGAAHDQVAAYPFHSFGRFVHLAGVVEGPGGEARLYEDGVLKASAPVETVRHPDHNMEFGKTRWYVATAPLCGLLDEAAAWKRALPPEEIRSLARSRRSIPRRWTPLLHGLWRLAQAARSSIPPALRMLDRFNVRLHEGRASASDLPDINLQFSSGDARHLIRAHDRSLASGRRTARGANPRRILAQYEGHDVEARIWLAGSDTRYPPSLRPGYVLETPENAPAFGARRLRLLPPESVESGLPGIAAAMASIGSRCRPSSGLCRLRINGQFKGIYLYDSFDRLGLAPGERGGIADGPSNPGDWSYPFLVQRPPLPPARAPAPGPSPDAQIEKARRLLVNDIFQPWSSREWTRRIRQNQKTPPPPESPASPYAMLGQNPSPQYIVANLDLKALRGWPEETAWRSSRPDVIDEAGTVTRPAGDLPVDVDLTAEIRKDDRAETLTLHFRVMPVAPRLPALMLCVDEPLSSCHRADFTACFFPAHGASPPRWLQGGQSSGGGIQHRGNTSYWWGRKKPISLRFDEPHRLLGPSDTRHLYLLNGYVDSTKLKNKLAFDLFRAFGNAERPRFAPEIDWTEVFVNGEYLGIYETCTRIDADMLGSGNDPADQTVVYKVRADQTLFADAHARGIEQVSPPLSRQRRMEPAKELMAFTSQADPETFAAKISDWIDLDNAIDLFLLLNFSGNVDGRTTNFSLARRGTPGARFFFIPWDYDHIFNKLGLPLSNFLFGRLFQDVPGFENRVRLRWTELRQGPLSEDALDARIREMSEHLAGYMDWEFALSQHPVPPTYLDEVEAFRQAAHAQLNHMDARFADPAADGGK